MATGKHSPAARAAAHAFLALCCAAALLPLAMICSASLKPGNLAPHSLLPTPPSLDHWKFVLGIPYEETVNPETGETRTVRPAVPPLRWVWNSIKVAGAASAGILALSATAAYAFARMRFRGRHALLLFFLVLQMFPTVLALVAIHSILDTAGAWLPAVGLNTHAGLILVYLGGIATHIWMIKGYFETIPASMEESACIDGATPFQTFWRILMPMSLPAFAVTFILAFIGFMSEYPVASVVLQSGDRWTLAVGANSFLYEQEKLWGRFAALAVLGGIPITAVFLAAQKYIAAGLTAGGVKD